MLLFKFKFLFYVAVLFYRSM